MAATSTVTIVFLLALAWRFLCSFLRRRRSNLLDSLHPSKNRHALNLHTLYVEFSFIFNMSIEFGLLRIHAIPQMSSILQKSGQFAANAAKRYDYTDIMLREMILHHVDGDRGSVALRRMNFIHSSFPINNAEYLYVLALLVVCPIEWAALYGYREWTDLEKAAYYATWHDIGVRMGLRDIPKSISACYSLKEEYEVKNMVYADTNKVLSDYTMQMFLTRFPSFLGPLARAISYSLMDERLLRAVGGPRQPVWLCRLSQGLLKLHGMVVGWMPPRPVSWAVSRVMPGCPKFQADFDPETMMKLAFHLYSPVSYAEGYRVKDLGVIKPGKLGKAHEGDLLCPLEQCSILRLPSVTQSKEKKKDRIVNSQRKG